MDGPQAKERAEVGRITESPKGSQPNGWATQGKVWITAQQEEPEERHSERLP